MPRDGSNNYSLPEAPFVAGTTAQASKINNNLSDIASALTASLTRNETTAFTRTLLDDATAADARTTLGATATGAALFTATDGAAAQNAILPVAWLDVASAATTDLGAANAANLRITGTTTITSFGTAANGVTRDLRFAGALTLTHSAALILPGAANITTAAGDTATAKSLGSGNWIVTDYQYTTPANARAAIGALGGGNFSVLSGSWTGSFDLLTTDTSFFDIMLPNNVQSIIGSGFITTNQSGGSAVAGLFDVSLLNGSLTVISTHTASILNSTTGALSNSGLQVGFDSIASGNSGWRLRFYGRKNASQGPFLIEQYQARIMCVTR